MHSCNTDPRTLSRLEIGSREEHIFALLALETMSVRVCRRTTGTRSAHPCTVTRAARAGVHAAQYVDHVERAQVIGDAKRPRGACISVARSRLRGGVAFCEDCRQLHSLQFERGYGWRSFSNPQSSSAR